MSDQRQDLDEAHNGRSRAVLGRLATNEYLLAALILGALVAVYFNPVIRLDASHSAIEVFQRDTYPWVSSQGPQRFRLHDQPAYVYPRQVFLANALRDDNQVPLWNPLTFGGHPFLAETGSKLGYPPFLFLSVVLDPIPLHDVYLMLHVFLAGLAAFAMMKQFGVRFGCSLLTGVAWAFNSYALLYYMLEMYPGVAAFLPLAVLFVRRWYDHRSWPSLLLGGLALGLLFLSTSVELAFLSFLMVGGYSAFLSAGRVLRERHTAPRTQIVAVLLAPCALVLLALAVSAVQLLPFLELSSRATRSSAPYSALARDYPATRPVDFVHLFVPPATPPRSRYALGQQLFLGSATGVLAIVGAFSRRRGAGLGRVLAAVLVLFVTGSIFTRAAYLVVPGMSSLHGVSRSLFLWAFAVAVLGGVGLERLQSLVGRRAFIKRGKDRGPMLSRAVVGAVVLVTFAQLFTYGRAIHPPFQRRSREALLPTTPALEAARATLGGEQGGGRVVPVVRQGVPPAFGWVLPAATNMAVDLPTPLGYEPIVPDNSATVMRALTGEPLSSIRSYKVPDVTVNARVLSGALRVDLLPRLAVTAVLAPPRMTEEAGWSTEQAATRGLSLIYSGTDGTVYRVTEPMPRALVVPDATWVASRNEALELWAQPDFDPRRQVILDGGAPPRPEPMSVMGDQDTAAVTWQDDRPNSVRLSVSSPNPGWLVLLDSWAPGWRATINGRSTDVREANVAYRAVRVPAGISTVVFSYRPTMVVLGTWISCTTAFAIIGVVVVSRFRRRSPRLGRLQDDVPAPEAGGDG